MPPDGPTHAVAFDRRSGRWYALNTTAAELWAEWHRAPDDTAALVRRLCARHPDEEPERITRDVHALVETLADPHLVVVAVGRGAEPAEVRMAAASADHSAPPGRWCRLRALAAFPLALLLLRLPFGWTTGVAAWAKRRCRRAPTPAETAAATAAVHRVARRYPGRAACMQTSLALFLALALARLRCDWCFGAAMDPYRFHAWIETAQGVVVGPGDDSAGGYTRALAV